MTYHSSNTRAQLAQFEGELVCVTGTIKEFRRKAELGVVDLLIVNCQVRRFDPDIAMKDAPYVRVDHLWDRVPVEDSEDSSRALLQKISSVGRVAQYARADGTVDWTVDTESCVRLDNILGRLAHKLEGELGDRRALRMRRYRQILGYADEGVVCWSWGVPTNEVLATLRSWMAEMEADIEREKLAPANGRCARLRQASRLPGRKLQRSRGFA